MRKWCREFKDGRTDIHDEQRSGRPSVSDEMIAKVEETMLKGRTVMVRELCEMIPDVSIDQIFTDHLGYAKDNARLHVAHVTTDLINKFGWDTATHPPYSPDIAPSDYHLFHELEKHLGGTHFRTGKELKEEVLSYLRGAAGEFYEKCIDLNGDYAGK
jgi:hypothetical protein